MRQTVGALLAGAALAAAAGCGGGGSGGGNIEGGAGGSGGGGRNTPIDPGSTSFTEQYFPEARVIAQVPSSWNQVLLSDPLTISAFAEPVQGANDQYIDNIIIAQVDTGNLPDTDRVSNITLVSTQTRDMDGFVAQEAIFDADVDGAPTDLRFMEITIQRDNIVFGLLYQAERALFNRNIEIARYVADNMRVGQIVIDGLDLNSDLERPGRTPIATDGTNFLVVTCRKSPEFPFSTDLVGQLIGADRQKIGTEILVHAAVDCRFTRPEITFDGANFLVTYMDREPGARRQILGRRISPVGVLLDNAPINISNSSATESFAPAVVYTGNAHMVVWSDIDSSADRKQLLGALVSPGGSVSSTFTVLDDLDALYPQVNTNVFRSSLAVASGRVMVVIEPRFAFNARQPPLRPIYAQILDLGGATQLLSPLLVREDNGDNPRYVQATSDSQAFLVTWVEGLLETNTISSGLFGIYARQIGIGGQMLNGNASDIGLEIQAQSDLPIEELNTTFIDGRYSVLWSSTSHSADYGIYENTVSSDLATITRASAVAGTRDAAVSSVMPRMSTPDVVASNDTTVYVWTSRLGTIDAWFSDNR